jgi:hypothetical protein
MHTNGYIISNRRGPSTSNSIINSNPYRVFVRQLRAQRVIKAKLRDIYAH